MAVEEPHRRRHKFPHLPEVSHATKGSVTPNVDTTTQVDHSTYFTKVLVVGGSFVSQPGWTSNYNLARCNVDRVTVTQTRGFRAALEYRKPNRQRLRK